MKIALAQLNFHIGNFELNLQKITDATDAAIARNADLIVFSELAITGYFPLDLLEYPGFIEHCKHSVEALKQLSRSIDIIIGCPTLNQASKGKKLYNSALHLSGGEIVNAVHKSLLPDYDVFDEYRYFEPAISSSIIHCKGKNIALTICEDLWDIDEPLLYTQGPMEILGGANPDLIINIAASPFTYNHYEERLGVLQKNARKYNLPVIYVNQVGANTQMIFDGGSMFVDRNGSIIHQMKFFKEDLSVVDLEGKSTSNEYNQPGDKIERIHNALVLGIKDYFGKMGFKKAIMGLSGGIDSAVTYALAVEALGSENVLGVLLPSQFSSGHSVDDAISLVNNVKGQYKIVKIEDSYRAIYDSMPDDFKSKPAGIAEENLQARIRGVILMAISNKDGYILLNTSNKSEMAVGYGTLYGDMCGGIAVLGDVYKTEVYALARYINRNSEIIPSSSISKPPSAELRHDQKDSDSLPEYDLLDTILYQYIEQRQSHTMIVASGVDMDIATKVLKLVNTNEYKRHQAPPILRVSSKAFGTGRKMPIVAKY